MAEHLESGDILNGFPVNREEPPESIGADGGKYRIFHPGESLVVLTTPSN
jgi:hypothetical protein